MESLINFAANFLRSFGCWGWIELISAGIVSIGCLGELWLLINKLTQEKGEIPKKLGRAWQILFWIDAKLRPLLLKLKIRGRKISEAKEKLLERLCVALVAIGVTLEMIGVTGSLRETAGTNNLAAAIGTTNAWLVASNLQEQAALEKLKLQVIDANNKIDTNDVRNWPISEMNAIAWFSVMGTNMVEVTNLPDGRKAQMTLWKNEREGPALDTLEAGGGDVWGSVWTPTFGLRDRRIYRVQLHSFNFLTAMGINSPPVKTIDDVHLVHIDLNFLPRDSEIANGRIILTVNNVTKYFDIPRQNDTNSNLGWLGGFPCWFIATNGVQNSEKQFLYLHDVIWPKNR